MPITPRLSPHHRSVAASLVLFISAYAQSAPPGSEEEPRQPPPEAVQACQSLGKGAACEVSTPRGKIKGRCDAPEGRPLACRPNDMPSQGRKGER